MPIDDSPTAQAIDREIQAIQDGFERLIDMGVPAVRLDLIVDYLRNKYGYKRRNPLIK